MICGGSVGRRSTVDGRRSLAFTYVKHTHPHMCHMWRACCGHDWRGLSSWRPVNHFKLTSSHPSATLSENHPVNNHPHTEYASSSFGHQYIMSCMCVYVRWKMRVPCYLLADGDEVRYFKCWMWIMLILMSVLAFI